jgi:hypothetical protein
MNVDLNNDELVLLIQLLVKDIVEKQTKGQETPFEAALNVKLLAAEKATLMEMRS